MNDEGLNLETPALLSIYGRNLNFVSSFDTKFSLYNNPSNSRILIGSR